MYKYVFRIALFAAFVMLSGCCKHEEEEGDERNTKRVVVEIEVPETKSLSDAVGKVPVDFNSGFLYFTTNSGLITTAVPWDDLQIGSNELEVSGASEKVYMVVNVAGLPDGGHISTVNETVVRVASQSGSASTNGVGNVSLYGGGASLVPIMIGNELVNYRAVIKPQPVSSRIEITSFVAKDPKITSFRVDGIFMNYFYEKQQADRQASPADLFFSPRGEGVVAANETCDDFYTGAYYPLLSGVVFDYSAGGLGTAGTNAGYVSVASGTGKAWAYNLLSPSNPELYDGTTVYFPHIVVRLSNVVYDGYTFGRKYLTMTSFSKNENTMVAFNPGYVYKLNDLEFSFDKLTEAPYEGAFDANVTVQAYTWLTENIKPDL